MGPGGAEGQLRQAPRARELAPAVQVSVGRPARSRAPPQGTAGPRGGNGHSAPWSPGVAAAPTSAGDRGVGTWLQSTHLRRCPAPVTTSPLPGGPQTPGPFPSLDIKVTLSGLNPKQILIHCLLCAQPWLGPEKAAALRPWPHLGKPWPNMLSNTNSCHKAVGGQQVLGAEGRHSGWPEGPEPSWVISLLNGLAIRRSLQLPSEMP